MAETVRIEKPSGVSVRVFSHGDESTLLDMLSDALGSFADIPRTKAALSSRRFDADGCFVAEENGALIGWVAVTRLPRDKWFVIRYLCVRRAMLNTAVAESLLDRAINYAESKGPEFLRATTPAIQPYVEVYQKFGFKPLRRDFRISWNIDDVPGTKDARLDTREVTDETIDSASNLYVRSLSPYWDWRAEEEGGIVAVAKSFRKDRSRGARWFLSNSEKEPAGLVGIIPDYYEPGVAWFRGAFVLPEHRGKGIGSGLMSEIARISKSLGQRKMVVYTFSYLDSLAPGALLYLKSRGRIEAEYLQLSRMRASLASEK
jgi:GNAT superfamily N-acetyltransferase